MSAAPKFVQLLATGWLGLLLGVVVGGSTAIAQPAPLPENKVKAAFLVNFPKYVVWPEGAMSQTNAPIVIGILGETKVIDELKTMTPAKIVNGSPVTFKRLATEDEAANGCHIVFVADAERRRIPALLEKLKGKSVLTVGESDDFLDKGGMINLVRRDRKVRLDVNLDAARKGQLSISSKLLAAADVVKGKAK